MSQTQQQQEQQQSQQGFVSEIKGIELYIGIALGHLFALYVGKWLDKFIVYALGGDPKNHAIYLYTVGLIFVVILAATELAPQLREFAG